VSEITSDSPNKPKRLGRGLGSLLGDAGTLGNTMASSSSRSALTTPAPAAAPPINPESRIWQIAIEKIKPSPYQPRSHFDKQALEELSQSIKASGLLQPIVVRKSKPEGAFEIVAGERRWRASQLAGLHEVPVIIKNYDDRQTLELALIENLQREDLNAIEEAEAYQRLAQEFNLTQAQVSEKVGKDRASIANALRLLSLPSDIREMLVKKEISVGHAKVLLSLSDIKVLKVYAQKIKEDKLTVRQLEQSIKQIPKIEAPVLGEKQLLAQRLVNKLREDLQKKTGTKVSIDYDTGKGKLSLYFYSDDELTQLSERILGNV
jgi:ParB family transcriptional regulator, chromosome partitioning protein